MTREEWDAEMARIAGLVARITEGLGKPLDQQRIFAHGLDQDGDHAAPVVGVVLVLDLGKFIESGEPLHAGGTSDVDEGVQVHSASVGPGESAGQTFVERLRTVIRGEMARRGVTQEWLAERLGFASSALSRRLSGETRLRVDEVAAIAMVLDIEPRSLVAMTEGVDQ